MKTTITNNNEQKKTRSTQLKATSITSIINQEQIEEHQEPSIKSRTTKHARTINTDENKINNWKHININRHKQEHEIN